jgi:predicted RNA-binding protein YlxR (DUF448 family)
MKNRPRTCVSCRGRFDKSLLLKVVRITGGDGTKIIIFDQNVKLQGRGAWVCAKRECVEKAKKNRVFEKVLKARVVESIYEDLSCLV